MGQIFNRIKSITKSHINDSAIDDIPVEDDDGELQRIINELNSSEESGQYEKSAESPMTIEKACLILGTKQHCSADEIKSAYLQKVKEYHPDKVASLGDELKKLAERKTLEINLAYEFLTKV